MGHKTITAEINLHYELHVPDGAKRAPLLIAVHGYAAHMRYMMREAKLVAPDHFVIASIQGPNKFFRPTAEGEYKLAFGWLSDFEPQESVALHHEFTLKVIKKHADEGLIDPDEVYMYGFSQSCALNFRFAFTHPDVLKGIVGVCGGIPSDLDESSIYSPTPADVLYVYGNKDEFYPEAKLDSFDQRLRNYLPNYESRKFKAGHEITDEMRSELKSWLLRDKKTAVSGT